MIHIYYLTVSVIQKSKLLPLLSLTKLKSSHQLVNVLSWNSGSSSKLIDVFWQNSVAYNCRTEVLVFLLADDQLSAPTFHP